MIDVIYVEREAREHPRSQRILERFSKATVIECERYGEVFNRASQNFRHRSKRRAGLGVKKFDNFVLLTLEGYGVGGSQLLFLPHAELPLRLSLLFAGMYRSANYFFVTYEDFRCRWKQRWDTPVGRTTISFLDTIVIHWPSRVCPISQPILFHL